MVRVAGFEPTASWTRTMRATNCATPGLISSSIISVFILCVKRNIPRSERINWKKRAGGMSVYSQSTQMVSQQRHAGRWGAVPGRSRKRGGGSQEQVRLTQLAICLALFLSIFLWKGIFPQKLTQVREDLLNMITTDLDFQGGTDRTGGVSGGKRVDAV